MAHEATTTNGIDAIRELEKYALCVFFQPTTKFILIDVTDLYTAIPREGVLFAFARLLEKHYHHGKLSTLSIDITMKWARLL